MWKKGWRDAVWANLEAQEWDVAVVGGGISGAGVFRAAAALGLQALLVEGADFAFGTSSRSSKLAHGGFRYLYNRQYGVTFESVRQRERLLQEARGLIEPLAFVLPNYQSYHIPSFFLRAGVFVYDLMAPRWDHQHLTPEDVARRFPGLKSEGLLTGFHYKDAVLDDARLVLRVLREGVMDGGAALNYARVEKLLKGRDGRMRGIAVGDTCGEGSRTAEARAKVVVNATGPWTDELRAELGAPGRLHKQRGSHILFPRERLPVSEALTFFHPTDRRAMFVIPWEGTTLVGTTDIDHAPELEHNHAEPFASGDEIDYIYRALEFLFPDLRLCEGDALSTFSGLRPTIYMGAETPSSVSRAHQVWNEDGLITISGGKLTTFRLMAIQTLRAGLAEAGIVKKVPSKLRFIHTKVAAASDTLSLNDLAYLHGRHGEALDVLLQSAREGEFEHIETLPNLWVEVRQAARAEGVIHLDDLLLRRVRLGLLLPEGGRGVMARVRTIAQEELGWDDRRWQKEEAAYWQTWKKYYSPTPG